MESEVRKLAVLPKGVRIKAEVTKRDGKTAYVVHKIEKPEPKATASVTTYTRVVDIIPGLEKLQDENFLEIVLSAVEKDVEKKSYSI